MQTNTKCFPSSHDLLSLYARIPADLKIKARSGQDREVVATVSLRSRQRGRWEQTKLPLGACINWAFTGEWVRSVGKRQRPWVTSLTYVGSHFDCLLRSNIGSHERRASCYRFCEEYHLGAVVFYFSSKVFCSVFSHTLIQQDMEHCIFPKRHYCYWRETGMPAPDLSRVCSSNCLTTR